MSSAKGRETSVPFSRAYWVVPDKFLAGFYPGSEDRRLAHEKLESLLNHGIRCLITLMEPDEVNWNDKSFASYEEQMRSIASSVGHSVTFERMSIRDTWIPSRIEMIQILDRIDQSIETGKPVYIHCWGGRGRTGTVVGCYLVRHGLASDRNVLTRIQGLRANSEDARMPSPETSQQVDMVLSWVEGE